MTDPDDREEFLNYLVRQEKKRGEALLVLGAVLFVGGLIAVLLGYTAIASTAAFGLMLMAASILSFRNATRTMNIRPETDAEDPDQGETEVR